MSERGASGFEEAGDNDRWTGTSNWLLRNPNLADRSLRVYQLLYSRINEDGMCWPSQKRMAREIGVSERSIRRAIADLKDKGMIEVVVKATSRGRTNHYRLMVHPFPARGVRPPVSPWVRTPVAAQLEPDELHPLVSLAIDQETFGSAGAQSFSERELLDQFSNQVLRGSSKGVSTGNEASQ